SDVSGARGGWGCGRWGVDGRYRRARGGGSWRGGEEEGCCAGGVGAGLGVARPLLRPPLVRSGRDVVVRSRAGARVRDGVCARSDGLGGILDLVSELSERLSDLGIAVLLGGDDAFAERLGFVVGNLSQDADGYGHGV